MKTILVINGHPDADHGHYTAALADAYLSGARAGGHSASLVEVARVPIDFLRTEEEFARPAPPAIAEVQDTLKAADHLVLVYPLWLASMPARLKAFLEHMGRADFFLAERKSGGWPIAKMTGKSARVIVTMGMPAFAYRLIYRAHSLKALEGGILGIAGFRPIRDTVIGMVGASEAHRKRMLDKVEALGRRAI